MIALKQKVFPALLIVLSSCVSDPSARLSDATLEAIAACSAGYGISNSAQIRAGMIQDGSNVVFSAELKAELQGVFIKQAKVTEERAVELYESYTNCINNKRSSEELMNLLAQRKAKIDRQFQELGLVNSKEEWEILVAEYFSALEEDKKILAHEAHRNIQVFLLETQFDYTNDTDYSTRFVFSHDPGDNMFTSQARRKHHEDLKAAEEEKFLEDCTKSLSSLFIGEFAHGAKKLCENKFFMLKIDELSDPCRNPKTPEDVSECFQSTSE